MMKKVSGLLVVMMFFFVLSACGEGGNASDSDNNESVTEENSNEESTVTPESETRELSVDSVLTAFQEAGLDAEDGGELTRDDFGIAPMKSDEAKRLLIPSLGEDSGGRIFHYSNQSDLEEMKAYYDNLGKESAMLYSHTAARDGILLQISGQLPDEEFQKYLEVFEAVGTGEIPKFEKEETVSFSEATAGETVTDDYGSYIIEKVAVPDDSMYETGPITFSMDKVMLATFIPNEQSGSLFDREELNLAIMLVSSENTSEDTVSFHPYSTTVTTNTQEQYHAQTILNEGDSEHIGQVKQDFRIPFNLEEENLSDINELTFIIESPAKDARSIGEDVKVDVSFE